MTEPLFTQVGTDAETRTMTSKFSESVSVLDFIPECHHADIAAGTSTFDCHDAIMAAIESRSFGPWESGFAAYPSGPAVYFPPGKYLCGSTIELKRSVRLHGDGCGNRGPGAPQLKFPIGVAGIVVNSYDTEGPTTSPPTVVSSTTTAAGTIIEGLQIVGTRYGATTHGIELRTRALIRNCWVTEFSGNGIHIEANEAPTPPAEPTDPVGNANNFRVEGGRVDYCTGHGFYTNGRDVNAGYVIGLDSSWNGGVGIYDSSYLGNTYIACHVEHNEDCGYRADGALANNVFVGCYDETSSISGPSEIYAPAYVVGGSLFNGNTGDAVNVLNTQKVTGSVAIPGPGDHSAFVEVGKDAGALAGALAAFGSNDDFGLDYRFMYDAAAGAWRLTWEGVSNVVAFYDTQYAPATLLNRSSLPFASSAFIGFPGGYFLGQNMLFRGADTAAPAGSGAGTFAVGDIIYNTAPTSGGHIGWVCTVAGSPGTWKTFGPIS